MARGVGRRCYTCRTGIRGTMAEHATTEKHRQATYAAAPARGIIPAKERPFHVRNDDRYREITDAQHADALARMEREYAARMVGPGPAWVEPDAEPAPEVAFYSGPMADRPSTDPCPRCGRSDWRGPKGRSWHLAENLDCARYRKPERHEYVGA